LRDTPKQSTGVEENKSSQSLLGRPTGKSSVEGKGETGTGIKATSSYQLPLPNPSLAGMEPFADESPETFASTSNPSAGDSWTYTAEGGALTEGTSTPKHYYGITPTILNDSTSRPSSEPINVPFESTKGVASPRSDSKNKPSGDFGPEPKSLPGIALRPDIDLRFDLGTTDPFPPVIGLRGRPNKYPVQLALNLP
jgi:hypothetical protein